MKPILISVVWRLPDYWVSVIPFATEGKLEWLHYHTQLFLQLCRNGTWIVSTEQPISWGRERLWVLVCWGHLGFGRAPILSPQGTSASPGADPCCATLPRLHLSKWKIHLMWPILANGFNESAFLQWKNGLSGNSCLFLMRLNIKKWFQSNDCMLSGHKHI